MTHNHQITLTIAAFKKAETESGITSNNTGIIAQSVFSFSDKNGMKRGFFILVVKEMKMAESSCYFELSIQPLRQGQLPEIVAQWFLRSKILNGMMIKKMFKEHLTKLNNLIQKSVNGVFNLPDIARALVPLEFDITLYSGAPPPIPHDENTEFERHFNPLLNEIKFSLPLRPIKRNRILMIEQAVREQPIELLDEKSNKKQRT